MISKFKTDLRIQQNKESNQNQWKSKFSSFLRFIPFPWKIIIMRYRKFYYCETTQIHTPFINREAIHEDHFPMLVRGESWNISCYLHHSGRVKFSERSLLSFERTRETLMNEIQLIAELVKTKRKQRKKISKREKKYMTDAQKTFIINHLFEKGFTLNEIKSVFKVKSVRKRICSLEKGKKNLERQLDFAHFLELVEHILKREEGQVTIKSIRDEINSFSSLPHLRTSMRKVKKMPWTPRLHAQKNEESESKVFWWSKHQKARPICFAILFSHR